MLLFFNTLSGLWLQNTFAFVFGLPILVIAAQESSKTAWCTFGAMVLLSLMLSGPAAWLPALSMLSGGMMLGRALWKGWSIWLAGMAAWAADALCLFLSMTLLASISGYTGQEERLLFEKLGGIVSWNGFLALVSTVIGLVEILPLVCMTIVGVLGRLPVFPKGIRLNLIMQIPRWWAGVFAAAAGLWAMMACGVLSCPVVLMDLSALMTLISFLALVAQGARILIIRLSGRRSPPWMIFLVMLCVFLPGLNLCPALLGFISLISNRSGNKDRV